MSIYNKRFKLILNEVDLIERAVYQPCKEDK